MTAYHEPVLVDEVLEGLRVMSGQWYVDATLGGGGHTEAILKAGGRVIGLDQDQEALTEVAERLSLAITNGNLTLIKANFRDIASAVHQQQADKVAGILMDLGVSSHQLDHKERGFSFESDTLDMRMDTSQQVTAADLIAQLPERDLATLFTDLGEERYARSFARTIVEARTAQPIVSGSQLATLILKHSPPAYRRGPIHPATRIFQALRLAVNDELDSLKQALPEAVSLLRPGGRLAVISFHSLEDRIVKQTFLQLPDLLNMTKTPVVPQPDEIARNPRSRSSKLRVAEKVSRYT